MMKHTLRCHDFGLATCGIDKAAKMALSPSSIIGQNHASPEGVAAQIAASFVARLANTASIGITSLRAIDDFGSHRTRISSC